MGRPIVIVLGMHRSGTSLCAHILSAMGIDMADEISANTSNAKGHWERWEIMGFHDRILRLFNRDYYGPLHDLSLPVAWWADPRVSQIKREIIAFLERRMGAGWFGFKDPRTVRLMPIWHQIFNELRLTPKVVLCLRNPAQVARSVAKRDNLDPALVEYRWLLYMVDFFRYCGTFDVCTINYEGWFRDPCANFEKLKKILDVEWHQSRPDLDLVLSSIVDPALRHDESDYNEPHQPLVRSVYRLASDCGRDGGAHDEVNNLLTQFISFQKLQAPLHQALENLAGVAAKYLELEQEAVALRADIEQHAATEAALRADIEQRAATEAALRAALDQAEPEVERWAATVEAGKAEIAAMRDALRKSDLELQGRAAEVDALERAQEILRGKLAEVEQRLQKGENVNIALGAEITSLSDKLAIAREVGGAAIAALRTETAAVPKTRDRGRIARTLRVFGVGARLPLPSTSHMPAGAHSRS